MTRKLILSFLICGLTFILPQIILRFYPQSYDSNISLILFWSGMIYKSYIDSQFKNNKYPC